MKPMSRFGNTTRFKLHRPSPFRHFFWILPLLLILVSGVLGGGYFYLQGSLPKHSGLLIRSGLDFPVTIERDLDGIPLIRAKTSHDGYFALGFVHAQDRFFQMEMQRRIGAGRLSEILGEQTISLDKTMRTLGLYRQAEESFASLSSEFQTILSAYAAGVNSWLAHHDGPLPPEFLFSNAKPEPWKPADSLVWGELMAFRFGMNYRNELLRTRLAERLTHKQMEEIFPPHSFDIPISMLTAPMMEGRTASGKSEPAEPQNTPAQWPDYGLTLDRKSLAKLAKATLLDGLDFALQSQTASNVWALSGTMTSSNKPLLANDPHLNFTSPILWYLARLEIAISGIASSYDTGSGNGPQKQTLQQKTHPYSVLAGATVPGNPLFIIGHNKKIAWGMTSTGADVQDVFIERIDPQNSSQYLTPEGARLFSSHEEIIRVGDRIETITIRRTRNGPVISDLDTINIDFLPQNHVLALSWSAHYGGPNLVAQAMFDMNRASNWPQFRRALRNFHAPMQNIAYADTSGTISMTAAGRVPIRRAGDGRVPVPGWTGEYDWIGTVPYQKLPQTVNPASGQLINANNPVVASDFPHLISADWPYASRRAKRIETLLTDLSNSGEKEAGHTLDDSAIIQLDTQSVFVQEMLPLMTGIVPQDALVEQTLTLLRRWDGEMRRTRPEPIIFAMWWRKLTFRLYADELGIELFAEFDNWHPDFVKNIFTKQQYWCDNINTNPIIETCADQISQALNEALEQLREAYGDDISRWRWGEAHQAQFPHPIFRHIPILRTLTGQSLPSDGDFFTVNRGGARLSGEGTLFPHVLGAGLRVLFDLDDLNRSRFIIATGQSGNPFSPHYDNMVQRWRDGLYVTLQPHRGPAADKTPLPVLTLQPAPN